MLLALAAVYCKLLEVDEKYKTGRVEGLSRWLCWWGSLALESRRRTAQRLASAAREASAASRLQRVLGGCSSNWDDRAYFWHTAPRKSEGKCHEGFPIHETA